MTLNDEDFEVVTGCAAVHPDQRGGQHVAMHCTGVRITHKPSGISVLSTSERSQHGNRMKAYTRLRQLLALDETIDVAMTLDKIEQLARRAAAFQSSDPIQDKHDLARALLAVLPVVRAAEAWFSVNVPIRTERTTQVDFALANAIDTMRSQLAKSGAGDGE